MKFFLTGADAHGFVVFHQHFIDFYIRGNEGIHGIIAFGDGTLNFVCQPAVKLRSKDYNPGIRCLVEVRRFKINGEGRLIIHKGKPAMVDKALPATVFLFPVFGNQFGQVASPKHSAGYVFGSCKLTFLNQQKFHVVAGKSHGGSQSGYSSTNDDTVEFFIHGLRIY